jgi:putative acetyltransferase
MEIRLDTPANAEISALLREHLEDMHAITPPESVHALGHQELLAPEITFWAAWENDELLGCGALKELDARSGEIKSMRTAVPHRGRGVASRLLAQIVTAARGRGYARLLLETGSMQEFAPARALYEKHGFGYRGPFAGYVADPNSVFMVLELQPSGSEVVCDRSSR